MNRPDTTEELATASIAMDEATALFLALGDLIRNLPAGEALPEHVARLTAIGADRCRNAAHLVDMAIDELGAGEETMP